jgi:hypothetical protein
MPYYLVSLQENVHENGWELYFICFPGIYVGSYFVE